MPHHLAVSEAAAYQHHHCYRQLKLSTQKRAKHAVVVKPEPQSSNHVERAVLEKGKDVSII
jgi:hypothetical protein